MKMFMSREGWDHINRFNHGDSYVKSEDLDHINGLIMDIYMSREGWDLIKWLNHGYLYVKRGLGSHLQV